MLQFFIAFYADETRVKEFGLKSMWRSPNGTIRNILNGLLCSFFFLYFLYIYFYLFFEMVLTFSLLQEVHGITLVCDIVFG